MEEDDVFASSLERNLRLIEGAEIRGFNNKISSVPIITADNQHFPYQLYISTYFSYNSMNDHCLKRTHTSSRWCKLRPLRYPALKFAPERELEN